MKVLCVGRNYAAHAAELRNPAPARPVWFWKPESAVVGDGEAIEVPEGIGAVHHEVELAVRVGRVLRRATVAEARSVVDAFTVANDVTAREMQEAAKREGGTWDQAKGFDTFLPLGPWQDAGGVDLQALELRLAVDGAVRQQASTGGMTWPVDRLLALASAWTTLRPGDVLLTGTPAGVGPIRPGETVQAEIVGVVRVRNPVQSVRPS